MELDGSLKYVQRVPLAAILQIFLLLSISGTLNSIACRANDKMYDDEIFADRFRYQLAMLEIPLLVRLSRLLHAHIAYEVAVPKSPQKYV